MKKAAITGGRLQLRDTLSQSPFMQRRLDVYKRQGGQQVIDLAFREPIHKGDGHIPIEQQALAGIAVGDIGKLVLGNAELFCDDGPVALGLGEQNEKIGVIQYVLNLPAGQKVVG